MSNQFYKVMFFDKRTKEYHEHFVFTRDMAAAKSNIESEEPYVQIISWQQIDEDDLPVLAVVIQK